MTRIYQGDPRYRFLKDAAETMVRGRLNMIPTILFQELAKFREDRDEVLRLISSDTRICPECGCVVNEGKAFESGLNTGKRRWTCSGCDASNKTTHRLFENLAYGDAQYDWPASWGWCWWTTDEHIAKAAPECGFHVYESPDFNGFVLCIDGGGYDFYEAHWVPLYLRLEFGWHERENGWDEAVIKATVKLHLNKAAPEEPGGELGVLHDAIKSNR